MTFDEAVDYILTVFNEAWRPTGFLVVWDGMPGSPPAADTVPTGETVWARATVRHATGNQSSLAGDRATRRYARTGTVFIQVFAPVGDGSAGYSAAQLVVDAYQAARHVNLWFRNVRLNEAGQSGAFVQKNVLADFTYDDVR